MRQIHKAMLPFSGSTLRISSARHIIGGGNGSVLLRTGGAGGGSSYSSVEDYTETTGVDPYAPINSIGGGLGRSRESVNAKLATLLAKTKRGKKEKNITFNL
jgi:hypothetical protein